MLRKRSRVTSPIFQSLAPDRGRLLKAIYQLDGDTLKVAHGEAGAPRPKDFTAKEGSGVTVVVLKRQKS